MKWLDQSRSSHGADRFRAEMVTVKMQQLEGLKHFYLSQGQNLALTVLHVSYSLESGEQMHA